MKTFSNAIKSLCAIALLVTSTSSFAIPTLGFGGSIIYKPGGTPTDMFIAGDINATDGNLSLTPDLATSKFLLYADFLSEIFVADNGDQLGTTTGLFGTTAMINDMLISDLGGTNGSLRSLLTGNISSLQFSGTNGSNSGEMAGSILLSGGLLINDFGGAGTLLAFTWNFNTPFGENVFSSPINGIAFGQITAAPVPEPMPLALLSIGLIGLTLTRRLHKHG